MGVTENNPSDPYADFVEHPRFGKGPCLTGLNPSDREDGVHFHWRLLRGRAIPGTAVAADLSRQTPAVIPVTHYFDEERVCVDCARRFLFFAQEQKHWYEELGFTLDSDCVRCCPCRRQEQGLARQRARYEELATAAVLTDAERIEFGICALNLIEQEVLGSAKPIQKIRMHLNRLSDERRAQADALQLEGRLHKIEQCWPKRS